MSENVPEYIAVSSFASQFEGDAETAGQLMDVLLRKHYVALSFEEIDDIFPHKESEEVRDTLELFVNCLGVNTGYVCPEAFSHGLIPNTSLHPFSLIASNGRTRIVVGWFTQPVAYRRNPL